MFAIFIWQKKHILDDAEHTGDANMENVVLLIIYNGVITSDGVKAHFWAQ